MNLFRTAAATSLVVALLTGCSSTPAEDNGISVPSSPSASPTPSASPSVPPSASPSGPFNSVPTGPPPGAKRPSGIPKTPTDIVHSPGWTDGWITRGGTGPCYGFADADGKPYAVYSAAGTALKKGEYVRVRLVPARLRIDCGEGTPVEMLAVERVR
ncbi:hypothetical protein [Actinoplanes sp. NPDC049316]|uniref:hypothetical protein n=1 Tax=Actinoplanes sp. NPDC049316 TaxID=3154727 RepID=UPI003427601E